MDTVPHHADNDNTPLKRCPTCPEPEENKWHPATPEFFHHHKRYKDGFQPRCKACRKAHQNQPEVRENRQAYLQEYYSRSGVRDEVNARNRARFHAPENHERLKASNNARYHHPDNHERYRAHQKTYYYHPDNHERILSQQKVYGKRPEVRARNRTWYHSPEHHEFILSSRRIQNLRPEQQERRRTSRHVYSQRPEIQERERERRHLRYHHEPEYRARILARQRALRQDPEREAVRRAKIRAYYARYEARKLKRDHDSEYYYRPEVQEHVKVYRRRPDIMERSRAHLHTRRARKKVVPGGLTVQQIQMKLRLQHFCCYYCFTKFEKRNGNYVYHIEHTIPLSRPEHGPRHDMSYTVLSCPTCNLKKHNKLPSEFPEGGRLL